MTDYKVLLDFTNALNYLQYESLVELGLDIPLIRRGYIYGYQKESVKEFVKSIGIDFDGSSAEEIAENFEASITKTGLCQHAKYIESKDDKIVIEMGDCVLSSVCAKIRNGDNEKSTPCPFVTMLFAKIEEKLGRHGYVEKSLFIPEKNITRFTLKME